MRLRAICKSKIHHARVTHANVDYIGSVAIDTDLLERADILPGEKVALWNVTNAQRLETYALPAPAGSGQVIVNGAAAHYFNPGDKIIIVAFLLTDEVVEPRMIRVDEQNRFVEWLGDNRMPEGMSLEGLLSPAAELVP
jgi:aspartate 1-decarboxylase